MFTLLRQDAQAPGRGANLAGTARTHCDIDEPMKGGDRWLQPASRTMMTLYFLVKYLHVLGAIVIVGTGTGIAFFMLMAHLSGQAAFIARTAGVVVIADMLFTLSAVLLQPISGGTLMWLSSTSLSERWLMMSLALYALAGLFWVPVVFMQIELRDLARAADTDAQPLPPRYFTVFRRWFICGIPGFGSAMAILWLMIAKPF
ncbi:putative membrane protein [Bradyrhizobium sp. USDA 4369]